MKELFKFGLCAALCGMFAACGDSGTFSSDDDVNLSSNSKDFSSSDSKDIQDTSVSSSSNSIKDGSVYDSSANTLTDLRDGQTYKTVSIGSLTWMAENLNYNYDKPTSSLESSSFCYQNSADSCAKYGRLYLWSAAMDSAAVFGSAGKDCGYGKTCSMAETVRGVCPEGWHLPNYAEWKDLFTAADENDSVGTRLKSTSGWVYNGNGDDSYGFSVLPAGFRNVHGLFNDGSRYARFWGSTEFYSGYVNYANFYYGNESVDNGFATKDYAFSVRCVMDSEDGAVISDMPRVVDGSVYDSTANTLTDLRDDQTYRTVIIGGQIWMAENLNFNSQYPEYDGWWSDVGHCYDDDTSYCDTYGRYYSRDAATDKSGVFSLTSKDCGDSCDASVSVRGICPEGWHLPSQYEYEVLINVLDMSFGFNHTSEAYSSMAGKFLKSLTGWQNNQNGTDDVGFSALPAGNGYSYVGVYAYFMSSSGYCLRLDYNDDDAHLRSCDAASVRCIKD